MCQQHVILFSMTPFGVMLGWNVPVPAKAPKMQEAFKKIFKLTNAVKCLQLNK